MERPSLGMPEGGDAGRGITHGARCQYGHRRYCGVRRYPTLMCVTTVEEKEGRRERGTKRKRDEEKEGNTCDCEPREWVVDVYEYGVLVFG